MSIDPRGAAPPAQRPPRASGGSQPPTLLRPHPNLLVYYVLLALLSGPAFPVILLYRYFRYHTLRYVLDDEGLTVRWGLLFRREVSLTYARIQDIHLTSNVLERWLGLGRVQLQTASGSAEAEVTLEGLQEFDALRDFFYSRMRGVRGGGGGGGGDELAGVLREVAAEVRALRTALQARGDRDA